MAPAGTAIEVAAYIDTLDHEAWITVADRGPGLPAAKSSNPTRRAPRHLKTESGIGYRFTAD